MGLQQGVGPSAFQRLADVFDPAGVDRVHKQKEETEVSSRVT